MDKRVSERRFDDFEVPNPRQQLDVQIDQKYSGVTWARGNVSLWHYVFWAMLAILLVDAVSFILSEGNESSFFIALGVGLVALVASFFVEIMIAFRKCASCERVVPSRYRRVGGFPQSRICYVCNEALKNFKVISDAEDDLEKNWQEYKRRRTTSSTSDDEGEGIIMVDEELDNDPILKELRELRDELGTFRSKWESQSKSNSVSSMVVLALAVWAIAVSLMFSDEYAMRGVFLFFVGFLPMTIALVRLFKNDNKGRIRQT